MQDMKFFISYISSISDLKLFISDLDKNIQISGLKFISEIENFRSEISLKNKISDLKSDLRKSFVKLWFMYFQQTLEFLFLDLSAIRNYV